MTRSSCGPNRCVNLSRHRCADLSSPVLKHARKRRSRSVHESGVSEVVIKGKGKKLVVGAGFDRTALACCESCNAFTGSERTAGPFSVDILTTNLLVFVRKFIECVDNFLGLQSSYASQESGRSAERRIADRKSLSRFDNSTLLDRDSFRWDRKAWQ